MTIATQDSVKIMLSPVLFDREQHMRWWYDIRNSDSVRAASRSRKKIKADEHRAWWAESAASKARALYFIRRQGAGELPQVVGIVRLDNRGSWTEVSIAVVPEWRGQGIAREALRQIIAEAESRKQPPLGAVIHAQNRASLALFIGCGFTLKKKGFVQVSLPNKKGKP